GSRTTPAASERPGRPRRLTILTHQYPEQTSEAVRRVIEIAAEEGVTVALPEAEVQKHGLENAEGCSFEVAADGEADLVVVLGGDGTILTALREFAGLRAPVFAVNYGAIGFLSTVDRPHLEGGIRRALQGDFEELKMPPFTAPHTLTARALVVAPDGTLTVLNTSDRDGEEVTRDGRLARTLGPREAIDVRLLHQHVLLAQVPGAILYHRFRDKFGRIPYR